jgi:hypothetical protein
MFSTTGCVLFEKNVVQVDNKDYKVLLVTDDSESSKVSNETVNILSKKYEEFNEKSQSSSSSIPEKRTLIHMQVSQNDTDDKIFNEIKNLTNKENKKGSEEEKIDALVLNTRKTGMLPLIEKIRDEFPEVLVVTVDLNEDIEQLSNVVDINLKLDTEKKNENIVQTVKNENAKMFLYCVTDEQLKDENILADIVMMKKICSNQGISFKQLNISDKNLYLTKIEDAIKGLNKKYNSDIVVYSQVPSLQEDISQLQKEYKFIYAPFDLQVYSDEVLKDSKETSEDEKSISDIMKFYNKIGDRASENAKSLGISNRIIGYPLSEEAFATVFGTDLTFEIVAKQLTVEDISYNQYLSKYVEAQYGIGAEFREYSESAYNVELYYLDSVFY